MTIASQLCDTAEMPKAETMEPLPEIDIVKLCKKIESIAGYNQRQMAELLHVHLKTYQSWRFDEERDQSGKAIARLFHLKSTVEKKLGIEIKLDLKEPKRTNQE